MLIPIANLVRNWLEMSVFIEMPSIMKIVSDSDVRVLQVLCSDAPTCHKLQEKRMWSHNPAEAKEEVKIDVVCCSCCWVLEPV